MKTEKAFLLLRIVFLAIAILFFVYQIIDFSIHYSDRPSVSLKLKKPDSKVSEAFYTPESMAGATHIALGQKIDVNTATVSDLVALPDLGPVLAERIVRDRQELGKFKNLEDLMRVKGLKQKKFNKIKNFIEAR